MMITAILYLLFLLANTVMFAESIGPGKPVVGEIRDEILLKRITQNGGRLAWYKGDRHDLIAFDSISDERSKDTAVFTMRPDGSEKTCVTCDSAVPKGFVGQPDWHPNGEHLIVQAENENSEHRLFEHVAWGLNNDLWIVKRDGTEAERIHRTPENHAALHPHFNASGTKIMFAERVPTGRSYLVLKRLTPGGENHWSGWRIHIADFDIRKKGEAKLSNHQILFQGRSGLYEAHGFTKEGKIVFSHTEGGKAYVDDIYVSNVDGTDLHRLVESPQTWDEHGHFSPSGRTLAFTSSRGNPEWRAPKSKANTLTLDLYIRNESGVVTRLTDMNALGSADDRHIVSDFDWDRSGARIAFQVAPFDRKTGRPKSPEIWMLTFLNPQ